MENKSQEEAKIDNFRHFTPEENFTLKSDFKIIEILRKYTKTGFSGIFPAF